MKSTRTPIQLPATALALCLFGSHVQAATLVFEDTFDYDGSPNPQTDLSDSIAARQTGGLTTSNYTEQSAGGGNGGFLTSANGALQLRLQTTNPNTGAAQSSVDLSTNFASSLVGEHYKISLTDLAFVRGTGTILPSDIWFSISIGDSSPSINGPNDASADAAALIRANGSVTKWEDNSSAAGAEVSGLAVGYGFATRFAIAELHIDETTDTAWTYFEDMDGDSFTSAAWSIDFDNDTNRFIELRAHQGAGGDNGIDVSTYINSMSVTVIPEPGTALLGGLSLVILLRRRR